MVRELGKGAMGIVYLGRDPVIGRMVALKTIRVVGEDDSEVREFGERFLREAQAAGILSHPNIVTVHDVGEDPDTHISFIAMEYVEGKNLKQLVAEKHVFAYERVAEIIGQVAEALDYAHRKGIVHRDVKPANVIITSEGAVKITDFGIAKIEKSNLTSEGQFLGTPNYMSPEQVTGDPVDGRSDLFSLGVVLYELLTKKKPFAGENLTSISYKIVHEPFATPETFDADIPPEFGPILRTALAKNPAERYQRGREFALSLYEFKARQEERQMLRDLGQMVAAAENLGGVAAVDLPPATLVAPPTAAPSVQPSPALTVALPVSSPDVRPGSGEFELGAVRSEPVAVGSESPVVDYSAPDWVVESGVGPKVEAPKPPAVGPGDASGSGSTRAVPARMEPVSPPPSDPLDGVTERLDLSKHAAFLAAGAPPPPVDAPPKPVPPPVASLATPSELTERIPTGTPLPPPVRPAPAVLPPAPGPYATSATIVSPVTPLPPVPPPSRVPPVSPAPAPSRSVAPPPPVLPVPARPADTAPRVAPPAPAPPAPAPHLPASVPGGEAASSSPGKTALRRDVNPRFVAMILGGVVLVALVLIGILVARKSAIDPAVPVDDSVVRETQDRRRLMSEGTKLSTEGKYDEALARFRELVRRSPASAAARDAVARTEALLATQQAGQQKARELAAHVAAAREAEAVPDDAKVVFEADAALAIDPENADAKELRSTAQARQASKSASQKSKEAALAAARKKAKATPVPRVVAAAAPATRPAPSSPVPTPGTASLRISFQSPVPRGLLMVGVGNSIVFRRDFDFGKSASGGQVDGNVTVPSGSRTVKVWLIATDRSLKPYRAADLVLPGGETRTLAITLDGSQNISFSLR